MNADAASTRLTSPYAAAATRAHAATAGEILAALNTSTGGLTPSEAALRLGQVGHNQLRPEKEEPWWEELLESLREPMQLLLVGIGVLYAILGRLEDAITILVVIALVSVIEAVNESRAKKAIASLRTLSAPRTVVRRSEAVQEIASLEVVPGDIVLLQQGSRVTADLRLLETAALRVDESSLTGESSPVDKRSDAVHAVDAPLAERNNMAFAGTSVTGGAGEGSS